MFKVRYRYFLILLLGGYSYFNIVFTGGDQLVDLQVPGWLLAFIVIILVAMVWDANRLIEHVLELDKTKRKRFHPLIVHFLISLIVSVIIAISPLVVMHYTSSFAPDLNWTSLKISIGFTSRINLFLHCVNAIVFYMNKYKRAQVEAEQLKIQNIEARFDALRNQINPHFLFNSLNVLSSLVYKDPDTSARFIEQLSYVYRYLLFNQDQKLIPLKDELDFLNAYIFLLKIRFQENLQVNVNVAEPYRQLCVAPSTLQILIENAIKHNVVSRRDPLTIDIFAENGVSPNRLVVRNNLNPKTMTENSSRLGLKNIQSRYSFLTGEDSVSIVRDDHFTVKVPLIEMTPALHS